MQKSSDHADQNQKHHKANKKDQTDQNQKHTSQAQKHASQNKGSKLIERVTKGRFEVTKRFQPPVENLNGYIVQSSRGQPQVLFTYKDQYIITGNIFTQNGANLSQHYKKKFIKSPLAKQAYNKLASRAWIEDGKDSAHHKLYVIVDPNCGYCHAMYEEIKNHDLISDGKLQIRWVPVGFLRGKDSQAKATAMLIDEKQAPKALRQDANAFKTGEMKPADLNSQNQMIQKAHKQVMKNTEFFRNNSLAAPQL
jgi:protein-disulfide isomerase